jgi:hypothetical protein
MVHQAVLRLVLSYLPKVQVQGNVSDLAIKEETIEAGARGITSIPARRQDGVRRNLRPLESSSQEDVLN